MSFTVMYDVMQWVDTNGVPASGFVLKAYDPGTVTPISIFIDKNGSSPQATITLDADGKPEVSGNDIVPFIDRDYKWAIFRNATDAGNNVSPFAGFYDNIPQSLRADDPAASSIDVLTKAEMTALTGLTAGVDIVRTSEFSNGKNGGGTYDIISGTGTVNGFDIIAHDTDSISFVLRIEERYLNLAQISAVSDGATSDAAVMDRALELDSTVDTIKVPDNTVLERHQFDCTKFTIIGGIGVIFSGSDAGFRPRDVDDLVIEKFTETVLTSSEVDAQHFMSLATAADVGRFIVRYNTGSGGTQFCSCNAESGRTVEYFEAFRNEWSDIVGEDGGEGYGIQYANENTTGNAVIHYNKITRAGRHSFYMARNAGNTVWLIGNEAIDHRENSTISRGNFRPAFFFC